MVTFDTKTSTFGDRTIVTGSYTNSDVGPLGAVDLSTIGFTEVNAVAHMGDSQTNMSVKRVTGNNINKPNVITVAGTQISFKTPIDSVNNGGGRFMIIGRRG